MGTLGLRAPCREPPVENFTALQEADEIHSDVGGWERCGGKIQAPLCSRCGQLYLNARRSYTCTSVATGPCHQLGATWAGGRWVCAEHSHTVTGPRGAHLPEGQPASSRDPPPQPSARHPPVEQPRDACGRLFLSWLHPKGRGSYSGRGEPVTRRAVSCLPGDRGSTNARTPCGRGGHHRPDAGISLLRAHCPPPRRRTWSGAGPGRSPGLVP